MPDLSVSVESHPVTMAQLHSLMRASARPCVSIYIAAAPAANADQGRIRFKTAVRQVEQALGRDRQPGQVEPLLEPLRRLEEHDSFWLSRARGLATFLSPDRFHLLDLVRDVKEVTIVADSFHVRPLIRMLQSQARFQVLCVSADRVALYEGDRDVLDEVPLHRDVPRNMGEALGQPSRVTDPKDGVFVPDDSDTRSRQLRRYFRRLDDAIWEHHSRDSGLPLILAALPEYQGLFRDASRNQLLSEAAIRRDGFKDMDARKLAELAWRAIEPLWLARIDELRERYDEAASHGRGVHDLEAAARHGAFGNIQTLILRYGRRIGGVIDRGTGAVTRAPIDETTVDDVLDDLAELVLRSGGEVLVVADEKMPRSAGDAPLAAILRHAGAG